MNGRDRVDKGENMCLLPVGQTTRYPSVRFIELFRTGIASKRKINIYPSAALVGLNSNVADIVKFFARLVTLT